MAEFGMTRVRIGLFQHALAHPEANSERFESIEAKLDELRSYLYANRESVRGYAEAYRNGDCPCGEHRQSIDQLAHVQEAPNGMEPSRSPAIASRENRDHQRSTGAVYRASFSTGGYSRVVVFGNEYRRLTPRFLPVSDNRRLVDWHIWVSPAKGAHNISQRVLI
jgi:hypothetical protein